MYSWFKPVEISVSEVVPGGVTRRMYSRTSIGESAVVHFNEIEVEVPSVYSGAEGPLGAVPIVTI